MFSFIISNISSLYAIDYFDSDWNYKRNITITANENTPIDYNVLIQLTDSDLGINFNWSNSCEDIRFTDNFDGDNLNYWIDECETVGKTLDVWIKVDKALTTSEDYIIDIFYGKSGASSESSASSTFKNDEVYLVTGDCDGGTYCDMQNAAEALTYRANVGINGMDIHGSDYFNGFIFNTDTDNNPFSAGTDSNYFSRYRTLFIPDTSGSYVFGSYVDDDNQIAFSPLDQYGSGIQTGTPHGAFDIITTQYNNWYGGGTCGNTNAIEGSRSLDADKGYWIDFLAIEGGGGDVQGFCLNRDGNGFQEFLNSNFAGQYFAREYVQDEPSISSISSEIKKPNYLEINFNGILTAVTNKIKINKTKIFSVDVSCEGINTGDSCGTVSTNLEINSSGFSNMATGSGTPFYIIGSNTQNCILNYGESCTLNWIVNSTGTIWTISDLRINSDSNVGEITDKISQEFQVEIVAGDVVSFNATSVEIPIFTKNSGDESINILAVSDTGDNTNLQVACESGDCAVVYDNFVDGLSLNEGLTNSFSFSCDDGYSGYYSALYSITSDEFVGFNYINVSCNVLPLYGPISALVNNLDYPTTNVVQRNKYFDVNATVNCDNNCGNISAYAVIVSDPTTWWAGSSWSYRDYLNFTINEDIPSNYQVLAKLNESNLGNNFDWSNSCEDIRTYSNSGSSLDYWVEKCDNSTKELELWIELSSAHSLGDDVIVELYFGNSGASSLSSAVNTFRNNEMSYMSGNCPSGQPSCNHVDNQGEADYLKQNIGTGVYTVHGSSYVTSSYIVSGSYGVADNYYSRLRTLFIPSSGGSYSFGIDGDDGVEIGVLANDGYGNGFQTPDLTEYERLGYYYGGHGFGTCGTSGTQVSKTLVSGEGYWIDMLHEEGTGGDGLRGCLNSGGGYNVISTTNYPGQLFARNYVDSEPSLSQVMDGTFTYIPTSSDLPLWTSSLQPQICNPIEDGSCNFLWSINATGPINSSYDISIIILSDIPSIKNNKSIDYNIFISEDLPLSINLISPINGSSFLSNDEVEFTWEVLSSNNDTLDCSFYLNSNFIQNVSCVQNEVTSFNYSIEEGLFNWSIFTSSVPDGDASSEIYYFNTVKKYHSKVSKTIEFRSSNVYDIITNVENLENYSSDSKVFNFVTNDFISSNFNPVGPSTDVLLSRYIGISYYWDFILGPNSESIFTFDFSKNSEFARVEENYLVGLE
jgi:hypothetical protein